MGFFSNFLSGAKELTKVSNGVVNVNNLLEYYEEGNDLSFLYMSAWVTRVAVLDVVEKNNYPSHFTLFVPIHGHQTRITIAEAYLMTITRIMQKASERGLQVERVAQEILDKGDAFYDIDSQIPEDKKQLFSK